MKRAPDFTSKYNTDLSPAQEKKYNDYRGQYVTNKVKQGDSPRSPERDYDLRGAFKAGLKPDKNGHLPDTYKKPNHITFSNESVYHGVDGHEGGKWTDKGKGRWDFQASKSNLKYNDAASMQQYFKQAEPKSRLLLPKQSTARKR